MDWGSAAEAKITQFLELLRSSGLQFDYAFQLSENTGASASGTEQSEPRPRLSVEFSGPDAALMVQRGGELLHAIESMASSILRLEPEQHDELSFDALGYKQQRREATRQLAQGAIETVRATSQPYVFPPMNSRERRMLHLLLAEAGHPTASSGEGPRRFVVLYPLGQTPTPERFDPPPQTRSPGFLNGRGGSRFGRRSPPGRGPGSTHLQPQRPQAPAPPRLDPNGNPVEPSTGQEKQTVTSEEERLASLRRAFRKR